MRFATAIFCALVFALPAAARDENGPAALAERWRAWVASETRPRIGIALGGGGARGMAHVGVIRSLRGAGIPIDRVTGTSIGSFIGALFSSGASIDQIEDLALKTNWSNLIELKLSRTGFFSTSRLEEFMNFHLNFLSRDILRLPTKRRPEDYLSENLGTMTFDRLQIPFACTATDLYSGEIVTFDSGPVAEAVRASCSIPGLFEPVTVGDRVLVDGGVLANLPVALCRSIGAGIVIAVDVESDSPKELSGLIDILGQIIRIQGHALTQDDRRTAAFIVEPSVGSIKNTELDRSKEAVREGEIAGFEAADRIKRALLGLPGAGRAARDERERDADWQLVDSIRTPAASTLPAPGPGRLLDAARAARRLGLSREILRILSAVPAKQRTAEYHLLSLWAALRVQDRPRAEECLTALRAATVTAGDREELVAAAIDAGFDDLARKLETP